MLDVERAIATLRLVPVVVINDAADAWPLAQALKAGGLPCAEVTFRTAAAEAAIREIARDPDVVLGAGTVLHSEQVDRAVDAGASFIVTPGFSSQVVRRCQERGVPVFPGVATPTEVQMGLEAGLNTLKFFPAESVGGIATLKAIAAPYSMMQFIPTGGITPEKLLSYLGIKAVLAVGGSWMAAPELIKAGDFDAVTRLAAEAVAIVRRG
jgi:2-dehydro-3-deoxyphosphogluconate aldolase/(4S)-4-hydroxy-2-oxoglutarate aldolase